MGINGHTILCEDYVSFETAKLLKEKGFDEITFTWYTGKGKFCVGKNNFDDYHMNHFSNMATARDKNKCSAPTLQMAMKWIREVHKIHIIVNPYTDKEGQHWSFIFDKYAYGCWQELGIYITDSWGSYEEACEVAIKYCLENLI